MTVLACEAGKEDRGQIIWESEVPPRVIESH